MYLYCIYTAMPYNQTILKFSQEKIITFYILLASSSGCLLRIPFSNSVCCAPLDIRHRVPGDFIHLVDL